MFTALHTWSFRDRFKNDRSFDIFKALDLAAEMGFAGVEVMAGKAGSPPDDLGSDDPAHLRRVVAHAEKAGVRILSLSTYNDFAFVKNESWRLDNVRYVKKWLGIASDMGVPNIRMLTGYLLPEEPKDKLERLVLEGIRECVPYAEKAGVNMALENHSSVFMSADEILKLIDEVGSPRLTTCPDPTNWSRNFFSADCPADERENVFTSTAKLAPRATQSHLKVKGARDGKLIGWEDDLDRLIRIYRDAGYDGALAFESIADGDLIAPLRDAKAIVDAAIDRVATTR